MALLKRLKERSGICAVAVVLIATLGAGNGFAAGPDQDLHGGRHIVVPGTSTQLTVWQGLDAAGQSATHYAIDIDGNGPERTGTADYTLGLRYAHFDPLAEEPPVPEQLRADQAVGLYIVQFVTPPIAAFAEQIEDLGGIVRHYVAQYAYLIEATPAAREQIADLPYVRWVGVYEPAYRLEEFMLENLEVASEAYPLQRYNIQVLSPAQKPVVADRIASIGGQVDGADAGKHLVEATLTPNQLFEVVRWNEINFVDRWGPYETDMNIAREVSGANYIEGAAGYTGEGVRGEVYDSGFNMGHHDFQSRPLIQHGYTGSADHGSSTSGIVFGDGSGNAIARGMLPDGQGIISDYNYTAMTGQGRYNNTMELLEAPYFAVFQTASVGSPRTTQYTTVSADTDEMILDSDLVHVQSQSNSGWEDSRPQAWAKNIISGGGVYHYNTANLSDDCWCNGASTGPASDGRIKPTLCHFYDQTYTVTCCGYESYTAYFGGTSGATPIIAGHVGLFMQMWSEGIFGNEVDPEGTVFSNRPHVPTAKALMINTARQYDFSGPSHDKTRTHQGWGMPDVQQMYDLREKIYVVDEENLLRPFQVEEHVVVVEAGEPAFKATMAYADLAGNPAVQSQHRINDLTLKVTSPSGTIYYGNVGLYDGPWSEPGGDADTKNTVECVYVENPAEGEWTVEVSADEIVQDAEPSTLAMDARYSLVVSGVLVVDFSDADGPTEPRSTLSLVLDGPNPASRTAHFKFSLSQETAVELTVHDAQGRVVATLLNQQMPAGTHQAGWNGKLVDGSRVQPGMYFVRLRTAGEQATQKVLMVK